MRDRRHLAVEFAVLDQFIKFFDSIYVDYISCVANGAYLYVRACSNSSQSNSKKTISKKFFESLVGAEFANVCIPNITHFGVAG